MRSPPDLRVGILRASGVIEPTNGDGPAEAGTAPRAGPGEDQPRLTPQVELARLDRRVLLVGGAVFAVLMALSGLYGFHRDELYFLDCARHFAPGYVDQPVLTPLLAQVSLALFGVSLPGLRLWPALAAGATVVLAGFLARELGGGRRAQILTALGVAVSPFLLGADHLFGPTAFDILAWSGLSLIAVRIGRTGRVRLWVPAGLVLGLGLANKHSIGFLAVALLAGTLLARGRAVVANRWFLLGALIAAAGTAPDLWWQAHHDWASLAMTHRLNQENGGVLNGRPLVFIISQAFMATPVLIGLWVSGLRALWRCRPPLWRGLAFSYGALFVFFALTSGTKPYYVAGMYPYLLAAGAVVVEPELARIAGRMRAIGRNLIFVSIVVAPFVLPVVPPSAIGFVYALNQVPAESVGWPELVGQVSMAWHSLPPAQRINAVIFTADYGEEGAINELGRNAGLPEAVGGHNNDWWWGPGNPAATTVLAISPGPLDVTNYGGYLRGFFHSVRVVATIHNYAGLKNQEAGGHLYLCTGPDRPWGQMWPQLRHYD